MNKFANFYKYNGRTELLSRYLPYVIVSAFFDKTIFEEPLFDNSTSIPLSTNDDVIDLCHLSLADLNILSEIDDVATPVITELNEKHAIGLKLIIRGSSEYKMRLYRKLIDNRTWRDLSLSRIDYVKEIYSAFQLEYILSRGNASIMQLFDELNTRNYPSRYLFRLKDGQHLRSLLPEEPCCVVEHSTGLSMMMGALRPKDSIEREQCRDEIDECIAQLMSLYLDCSPKGEISGKKLCHLYLQETYEQIYESLDIVKRECEFNTILILCPIREIWANIWADSYELRRFLITNDIIETIELNNRRVTIVLNPQKFEKGLIKVIKGRKEWTIQTASIQIDSDNPFDMLVMPVPQLEEKEGFETVKLSDICSLCDVLPSKDCSIPYEIDLQYMLPTTDQDVEICQSVGVNYFPYPPYELRTPSILLQHSLRDGIIARLYNYPEPMTYSGWLALAMDLRRVNPYYLVHELRKSYFTEEVKLIGTPYCQSAAPLSKERELAFRQFSSLFIFIPKGTDSLQKQQQIVESMRDRSLLPESFVVTSPESGFQYVIDRQLGSGGFGNTYLAKCTGLRNGRVVRMQVALKEFYMRDLCSRNSETYEVVYNDPRAGAKIVKGQNAFVQEAKLMQICAPDSKGRIAEIYDAFASKSTNTSYYSMEYIPGGSLQMKLNSLFHVNKTFSESDAIEHIIKPIGNALSVVHANGALHLDIKPDNIMLDAEGNGVLIDFGIARFCDDEGRVTTTTSLAGSWCFMAPEYQYNHVLSPRCDIYSLACVLFYILSGGEAPEPQTSDTKTSFHQKLHGVTKQTQETLYRALSRDPKLRPQSIRNFIDSLE